MMVSIISLLLIFPFSFLVYAMSERLIAKHESRVGREILIGNFYVQTWFDSWAELKSKHTVTYWVLLAAQISVVFLFEVNVEYLLFIYLAANGFLLAHFTVKSPTATYKIEADRAEVRYSVATVVALFCAFGCFTLSKSTGLSQLSWSWLDLFFVIPFQVAGMIFFAEPPFQGMDPKPGWIQSLRFYVWSLLCVKLFLGGGLFILDLHLKAAVIYIVSRVVGLYFPRFQQRDLLRTAILYLLPITGLVWLAVILGGVFFLGDTHV